MDTQTSLLVAALGSPWLIVGYVVRMIFRGDLVTRREHEVMVETNRHLTEQNSLMLNSAIPTVNAVLTALHQAARGDRA
jgi:hypothetical protein